MTLLPTPWPADPIEGEPGHFDHTNWVKASLIALDNGKLTAPSGPVPAGKVLGTTAQDTWAPIDMAVSNGVPTGAIVAFHGGSVPSGWAVCDGQNGTPDLRDRFIVGASPTKAAGSSGGQESVALTAAQSGLPAHTHTTAAADAAHTHTFKKNLFYHNHGMGDAGTHRHGVEVYRATRYGAAGSWVYDLVATGGGTPWGTTNDAGSHSHGIHHAFAGLPDSDKFTTDSSSASHSHNVNPNTAANASQAHSNMPPYYALVYIMKL